MRYVALVALVALGCAQTESPLFAESGAAWSDWSSDEWNDRDRYDVYFGAGMRADSRDGVIRLLPGDLTTGAIDQPWIFVEVPPADLAPEEVAAVAARYRLLTWPERQEVPTDAVLEGGTATHSRVALRTRDSLSDRWYAIRGTDDLRALPQPDVIPRDGDPAVVVSRFLVGSSAVVRRVSARTTTRATTFIVWYTQRVFARPESYEVSVGGRVEPLCRLHNAVEMEEPGSSWARILCPPLPWSSLVLRHTEPLLGAGGTIVSAADGVPMEEVDLAFGVGEGDGSHRRVAIPISHEGQVAVLVPTFGLEAAP